MLVKWIWSHIFQIVYMCIACYDSKSAEDACMLLTKIPTQLKMRTYVVVFRLDIRPLHRLPDKAIEKVESYFKVSTLECHMKKPEKFSLVYFGEINWSTWSLKQMKWYVHRLPFFLQCKLIYFLLGCLSWRIRSVQTQQGRHKLLLLHSFKRDGRE